MYYLIPAGIVVGVILLLLYYRIYKDKDDKGNLFNNILGAIFFGLILVLFLKSCVSPSSAPDNTPARETSE